MDKLLPTLYADYGRYVNQFRAFPSILDGSKLVEKRLLYSLYEVAKNRKFVKSATIVGQCIGKYHPHGDCLHGDTEILLLNGTSKSIKWLAENDHEECWVYSCDPETGKVVPAKMVNIRIAQTTNVMYKVILDNGEEIKCTKNHPFMMKDCSFVRADELESGMSLMPLTLKVVKGYMYYTNGNINVRTQRGYGFKKVSDMVCRHVTGNEEVFSHHINRNKVDDNPDNLQGFTSTSQHGLLEWKNAAYRRSQSIKHKLAYSSNQSYRRTCLDSLETGRQQMFSDDGKFREKTKRKNSKLITIVNKKLPLIKAIRILQYLDKINIPLTIDNYNIERSSKERYNYPFIDTLIKRGDISNFDDLIELAKTYNHVVVSVERIDLPESISFYDGTVEKYHNFAIHQGVFVHNSSTYQTLVNMVQNGLADGQGNWGADIGIREEPAAAYRYTEVRPSSMILDMAFECIDAIPLIESELQPEPYFLPTMLPICLMGTKYCTGLGFGYRTQIPTYTISDLIKRLYWLVTKKGDEPIIRPITDCEFLSGTSDFKQLLETGKAKIEFKGKFSLSGKNSYVVTSTPPTKSFSVILKKLEKYIATDKSVGWNDDSKTSTRVRFTVVKPRMIKVVQLKKLLDKALTGSMTFECHVYNRDGKVVLLGVDGMLLNVYKIYTQVINKVLAQKGEKLQNDIDEMVLIAKIKPLLSRELKINPDDVELVARKIASELSQTPERIKEIFSKYTIARIFKIKTDTQELVKQKKVVDHRLKHITEYIWKDKYSKLLGAYK